MIADTARKAGSSVLCAHYNWLYTQLTCLGSANLSITGRGLKPTELCKVRIDILVAEYYIPSQAVGNGRPPAGCSNLSLESVGREKMHNGNKQVENGAIRLNAPPFEEVIPDAF